MAKLDVDTKLIETLAELLQRTGLTEIELAEGAARIRVARQPAPVMAPVPAPPPPAAASTVAAPALASAQPHGADPGADHPGAIRAPMVGTAYLTPEPGAPPFVAVGHDVQEGQTLMIIEAMKVMNPIRAPKAGRVREILIESGDPVEYGELLLVIV